MFKMAIDSSGEQTILSTGVVEGGEIKVTTSIGEKSENLSLLVDEHLQKLGLFIEELEQILIGIGPGNFTGIRGGVAYGKALAYGRNIEIRTFSLLDVVRLFHIRENRLMKDLEIYAFMDAKNQSVFVSASSGDEKKLAFQKLQALVDLDNWFEGLEKKKALGFILYGLWRDETMKSLDNFFNGKNCQVIYQKKVESLALVFEKDFFKKKELIYQGASIFKITPNYLRPAV